MSIILLLMLVSCVPPYSPAWAQTEPIEIRIVWHRTFDAWKACVKLYPHMTGQMLLAEGCFHVTKDGVCHVYAPDKSTFESRIKKRDYDYYAWAILGHEVKHCFDGLFHD